MVGLLLLLNVQIKENNLMSSPMVSLLGLFQLNIVSLRVSRLAKGLFELPYRNRLSRNLGRVLKNQNVIEIDEVTKI